MMKNMLEIQNQMTAIVEKGGEGKSTNSTIRIEEDVVEIMEGERRRPHLEPVQRDERGPSARALAYCRAMLAGLRLPARFGGDVSALGAGDEEAQGAEEEEAPVPNPAAVPLRQHSQLDQLVERFDQWETLFEAYVAAQEQQLIEDIIRMQN
ncbi:hypothetical protein MA16_Dca023287 [Dendrobium catenatum]|uniref:Uncharacterized protein n=1 Tax=Dendrobium catenatum TaxID=906689 RepID=A0A2I0X611_9ASPA|nr:hypothetical protein MA16_Dca023287 [Dendrobium catenatum]